MPPVAECLPNSSAVFTCNQYFHRLTPSILRNVASRSSSRSRSRGDMSVVSLRSIVRIDWLMVSRRATWGLLSISCLLLKLANLSGVGFLYLSKVCNSAVREVVRAFEPFHPLDTDAADKLNPVLSQVAGLVYVAGAARGKTVVRLKPKRRIRPCRPVVAGVALTGAVVGMAAGHAGHAPIHQPNPAVKHRLRLARGLRWRFQFGPRFSSRDRSGALLGLLPGQRESPLPGTGYGAHHLQGSSRGEHGVTLAAPLHSSPYFCGTLINGTAAAPFT